MTLGYDGSIRIDTKIDEKGFNRGIKSMSGTFKKLTAIIASAFAVGAIVLFSKSAVSAASDLASAMTGLKSIMDGTGKSFAEARGFIDDYISDGLIPATDAITAYKNLALRGYDTSQINQTLIALKDSAAFGRQSALSLGKAVRTATEGLKNENSLLVDNAGVTKNVAKIWKDYAESIGTTAANLTKQQKIQAEVNGILEETRFQTGDAAKLTSGYAGLVSALGTSFYNLRVAVGNTIIPILSAIIPIIRRGVDGLTVIINQVGQLVAALFGINPSIDEATAGTDALAESTEGVEKAAKGALAAFDDLNVLQPSAKPADETTAGAIDTGAITDGLDSTANKFEAFVKRLKEIFEPVKDAIFGVVAAGAEVLSAALEALRPVGEWLFENFLKPLGEWAGQAFLDFLGWLADRLNDLADWINTHQRSFQDIVTVIGAFAAAWLLVSTALGVFNAVLAVSVGLIALLGSPIFLVVAAIAALIAILVLLYRNWDEVKRLGRQTWEVLKNTWQGAARWFNSRFLKPIARGFERAWDDVREIVRDAWFDIQIRAENAYDTIVDIWDGLKDRFNNSVLVPLQTAFADMWSAVFNAASNAWETIKTVWRAAPSFFSSIGYLIQNALSTVASFIGSAWRTMFRGVTSFKRGQINVIIGFLNGMLAAVASAFNSVIGAMNSINVTIPSWVPQFGGNSFGVYIPPVPTPRIPMLAQGAVIPPNAQFLAMLGDQTSGRNIEAPESLLRQIVRDESGGQAAQEITIRFAGSLAAFMRELKPYADKENKRVGGNLIKGMPS